MARISYKDLASKYKNQNSRLLNAINLYINHLKDTGLDVDSFMSQEPELDTQFLQHLIRTFREAEREAI